MLVHDSSQELSLHCVRVQRCGKHQKWFQPGGAATAAAHPLSWRSHLQQVAWRGAGECFIPNTGVSPALSPLLLFAMGRCCHTCHHASVLLAVGWAVGVCHFRLRQLPMGTILDHHLWLVTLMSLEQPGQAPGMWRTQLCFHPCLLVCTGCCLWGCPFVHWSGGCSGCPAGCRTWGEPQHHMVWMLFGVFLVAVGTQLVCASK